MRRSNLRGIRRETTKDDNVFGPDGVLRYFPSLRGFPGGVGRSLRLPPEMPEFVDLKARYLRIFDTMTETHRLDALVFPQMRCELLRFTARTSFRRRRSAKSHIGGLPGIAVPAGYYEVGVLFGLIFVGRQWDEAELLGYAYAYEIGAGRQKATPMLD